MADQMAGIKEGKQKIERIGELGEAVKGFGKKTLGMGGASDITGKAGGKAPSFGKSSGGFKPYDTIKNKSADEAREKRAKATLAKEASRRSHGRKR